MVYANSLISVKAFPVRSDIWREGKEVINEKRSSKGGEEDGMVSQR